MDPNQIAKQMIQFNKAAFDNAFDVMTVLQERTENLIGTYLDQAPLLTEDGKKATADWMKAYNNGRKEFKTAMDDNFKKVEEFFTGYDEGAKSKTVEEPKTVKATPAKKAKKAAKKKPLAKKLTHIDKVVRLIQGSTEGISTAELKEKTGLAESQIWNIVNRASKLGKVKKVRRGVYGTT